MRFAYGKYAVAYELQIGRLWVGWYYRRFQWKENVWSPFFIRDAGPSYWDDSCE